MRKIFLLLLLPLLLTLFSSCATDDDLLVIDDIVGQWGPVGDVTITENTCSFPDMIAKSATHFAITKINETEFTMEDCGTDDTCANKMAPIKFFFGSELQMNHPEMPIEDTATGSCKVVFGGSSRLTMKDGETDHATVHVAQTAIRTVAADVTDATAECAKLKSALEEQMGELTEGTMDYQMTQMMIAIVGSTTQDSCSIKRDYDIQKKVIE